jgi:hypothetical protein
MRLGKYQAAVSLTLVKGVVAIICSLTLVCSQILAVETITTSPTKNCCGCDCGDNNCCVASSSSDSESQQPIAPTSVRSANELTLVAASVLAILKPLIAVVPSASISPHFLLTRTVPLFRQNCSLLV